MAAGTASTPRTAVPAGTPMGELRYVGLVTRVVAVVIDAAIISLVAIIVGVAINITHNGIGITSEMISRLTQTDQGIGLKSIQSRAQLINASIQYLTIGKNQAEVSIEVPFPEL